MQLSGAFSQRHEGRSANRLRLQGGQGLALKMPRRLRLLLLLCAALALPAAAQQERVLRMAKPAPQAVASPERRIALVIGNGQYKEAPLLNPVNDARAFAKALTRSGFKVVQKEN